MVNIFLAHYTWSIRVILRIIVYYINYRSFSINPTLNLFWVPESCMWLFGLLLTGDGTSYFTRWLEEGATFYYTKLVLNLFCQC